MALRMQNVVIDWSDVKHKYLACVERGEYWSSQPLGPKWMSAFRNPYREEQWSGGAPAATLRNLREGFFAPEFAHAADLVPTAQKRRNVWNSEDGDIDPGRLYAGRDDFYLGSQKRESKPGLRIAIEFCFAWTVEAHVIQQYGAWVAGLLGSLESSGYDIVVDLLIPLDHMIEDEPEVRTNIFIRVKRPNEVSDFTEWSGLFAPTGFRHLGFTAICLAGDKLGKRVQNELGDTIGGKTWGVDYDREDQTVFITVNQRAGGSDAFPIERLNQQAIKAGLLPDPEETSHEWP